MINEALFRRISTRYYKNDRLLFEPFYKEINWDFDNTTWIVSPKVWLDEFFRYFERIELQLYFYTAGNSLNFYRKMSQFDILILNHTAAGPVYVTYENLLAHELRFEWVGVKSGRITIKGYAYGIQAEVV